jgi:hypothetical protein
MNLLFISLKYNNFRIFDVTRLLNKKSVSRTIVMALLLVMALGFTDLMPEDEAGKLVHEFGEILEGVEAEILSIPNDTTPAINTADAVQAKEIYSELAYLQAFDEVIRKQIL